MPRLSSAARLLLIFGGVFVAVLLAGTALAFWVSYPAEHEALRTTLRFTGRLSFLLFLMPFAASPLARLFPDARVSRFLRGRRRELGVAFAGSQLAHAVFIAWLLAAGTGRPIELFVFVFGGGALVMTVAMLLTSFPAMARRVSPATWKRLHLLGMHWIAAIFAFDFVKGTLVSPDVGIYLPLATLILAVYGMRARAYWLERASRLVPA